MKLLVLILNDESKVDEVLLLFSELGVKGATVMDSVGMGSILGIKIPFFGKNNDLVQIDKPDNKTIFSVIDNETLLNKVINSVKNKIALDKPGTGFMFVIPVLEVYGTTKIKENAGV